MLQLNLLHPDGLVVQGCVIVGVGDVVAWH